MYDLFPRSFVVAFQPLPSTPEDCGSPCEIIVSPVILHGVSSERVYEGTACGSAKHRFIKEQSSWVYLGASF
jgi:hypothetical protein